MGINNVLGEVYEHDFAPNESFGLYTTNSSLFIALVSKDSVIIFDTPFSRNTHTGRGVKVGSHELYHDLMN